MKDYSGWKKKDLYVTSLQLDPQNPRIPPTPAALQQRDLVHELVEHNKIDELAREISAKGYYPIEALIGLEEEDGKTYVLEGNRRLCALKLLIQPELAPEKYLKRFRNLGASIDIEKLKKVLVLLAPTREAAAPLIMQKHTLVQVQKWSRIMQARFYRGLVRDGVPLDEVAKEYGVPLSEITKNLRIDTLYTVACAIELPEEIRNVVHDPHEFKISSLERLFDVPKARELLGIEFDAFGKLKGKFDKSEFTKALARFLNDAVREDMDTRTLNTADDVAAYVAEVLGVTVGAPPITRTPDTFTDDDLTPPAPTPAKPTNPKVQPRKTTKPKPVSPFLIPRGMQCSVANHRIQEVFGELRKLRIDEYPNAVGILLRVLLDLSVSHYMDKSGEIQRLLAKAIASGKAKDWYPTLSQMLADISQNSSVPLSPLARKKLNKMVSDQHSLINVNLLDGFAHNRFELPTARDLRGLWDTFEGILQVTLKEPPPAPPPAPASKAPPAPPPATQPSGSPTKGAAKAGKKK